MFRRTLAIPGFAAAAALLLALAMAGCSAATLRESAGEYLDDTLVTMHVKAGLLVHRELSAAHVNVETFEGQVQLSGFVTSRLQRFGAEAVARSIPGVSEVVNDIQRR